MRVTIPRANPCPARLPKVRLTPQLAGAIDLPGIEFDRTAGGIMKSAIRNKAKSSLVTAAFLSASALFVHAALAGASASDIDAQVFKGDRAYKRNDYAEALRIFRPLADQGDARAQNGLGSMYAFGLGVPQSYRESAKWYLKAAEQGDSGAQFFVGDAYDRGRGLPESASEAVRWYRLSASQGNPNGQNAMCLMYYLGRGVQKDYVQAFMWCSLSLTRKDLDSDMRRTLTVGYNRVASLLSADERKHALSLAASWKARDLRKGKTTCGDPSCITPAPGLK